MITLNMIGMACPKPVLETKKHLSSNETICTIVDNEVAVENIKKLATDLNACFEFKKSSENLFYVYTSLTEMKISTTVKLCNTLVINSEFMGQDEIIGKNLMQAAIHTLADIDTIPKTIILYNSGVKLFQNEAIFNDFKHVESLGVEIISCGACVEYFDINNVVGSITNMYEILRKVTSEDKIIYL